MKAFARLLDQLAFTPSRNAKLTLLRDYLGGAPDPERGWALASLTGALSFDAAKPGFIRKAAEARLDPQLFALSYDFVGDLAETVALVWPAKPGANREPELPEVVESPAHRLAPGSAAAAGTLAGCAGRDRPLGVAEAFDRRPAGGRVGAAGQAGAGGAGRCAGQRHRRSLAQPGAALWRPVRLAGKAQRAAQRRGAGPFPPGDAGAGDRRGHGFCPLSGGRLCRGMEMGRHPRPGRP